MGDARALAAAMRAAMHSDLHEAMGRRGRAAIVHRCSPEAYAARLIAVYQQCLAKS
jgi:hypothetical protein